MFTDGLRGRARTLASAHLEGMHFRSRLLFPLAGVTLLAALLSPDSAPAQTQQKWIARAVSVQGTVEARPAGATAWQPVKLNDTYAPGDTLRVRERSRADLAML